MAKDNTLGAPTEGLGQTVTFTASGGVGVPQLQIPDRGAVRMGTQGGAPTSSGQARQVQAAQPDPTMAALMKLGGNLLAPAVKREQETQFMQGMQRAAEGEAVKEIVDEQPWYSKVFGATSLVDGARTYTAAAKAASIATDLDSRMPEIAKMPGQAFASHVNDLLGKAATGDGATDAIVRQQFMSQMPDVMKRQARSHFLYQQEQLVEANRTYIGTAFAGLAASDAMARNSGEGVGANGSIPRNVTDDGDVLTAGIKALEVFNVPAGMDPKVHSKVLAAEVVQSVNNGSFAVVNMLEKSGAMGRFEPEQASAIRSAVNAKRSQIRAELPADFAKVLSSASQAADVAGNTPEAILAEVDKINKAYSKITGDEKPYVTAQGASSLLQALYRTQQQELEELRRSGAKATTAAEKEAKAQETIDRAVERLKGGAPVNDFKAEEVRAAWARVQLKDPVEANRARILNVETQMDPDYRDGMRNAVNNAKISGSESHMFAAYQRYYVPLVAGGGDTGATAAAAYAGDHAGVLQRYHSQLRGNAQPTQMDRDLAYQYAIQPEVKEPTKKEEAIIKHYSQNIVSRAYDAIAGWNDDIPVKNPKQLAARLSPLVVQGIDTDKAVKAALANNKDIYVAGGYDWKRGAGQTDLNAFYERAHKERNKLTPADKLDAHTVDSAHRNRAFAMGVEETAKKFGLGEVTQIFQVANANDGTPQFALMGTSPLGDPLHAYMTARDVENLWKTRDERSRAKKRMGPELTGVMAPVPDDRPSIYASPEEWAAYRKREAAKKSK
ncbi:internal virion protein [Curvibacter phage P26059B]|uniref:Internal virion protein n=1 Tax=Curvibacter phage P26059B TaxID=1983784 RepID=A0A384UH34_9CAUD|nr:internal virion protein [Curvibacter phage P26059B]ASJ79283.1 hypothetical protein P26059B_0007 [Curvibacter phage P26059B]